MSAAARKSASTMSDIRCDYTPGAESQPLVCRRLMSTSNLGAVPLKLSPDPRGRVRPLRRRICRSGFDGRRFRPRSCLPAMRLWGLDTRPQARVPILILQSHANLKQMHDLGVTRRSGRSIFSRGLSPSARDSGTINPVIGYCSGDAIAVRAGDASESAIVAQLVPAAEIHWSKP